MSYINKDIFERFANPAIVEQVEYDNDFDDLISIIDDFVFQITKIEIPDNPSSTPKWLIPNIAAILSKYIMNRMQNVSNELRNQINSDYDLAISNLKSVKTIDEVSAIYTMPNMLNSDSVGLSSQQWSAYK